MSREAKYRLTFIAPKTPDAGTPSGVDFRTLAGALTMAWANDSSGGRSLGIKCGGLPVMGEEDLERAFKLMRAVEGECPGGNLLTCAELVLREMGLE